MDEVPDDTHRTHRLNAGYLAAALLALSAFAADTTYAWPDGSHTGFFAFQVARGIILILIAALVAQLVGNPNKPDVRVAKAGILAGAMVAIVVGLNAFLVALGQPDMPGPASGAAPETFPGPAAWMLLAAGILLVYLRFRGALWPESAWEDELRSASERRTPRRR